MSAGRRSPAAGLLTSDPRRATVHPARTSGIERSGSPRWGVEHLSVRRGGTPALDDVTLHAPRGQVTAVVGGDGAGKTTLLRTLVGGLPYDSGVVRAPRSSECGFMPTGASGTWVDLTVDENFAFFGSSHKMRGAALTKRRDALLEAAGLTHARKRLSGRLSGGMRQKLAFCLAMLHEPELVVLDEPSTGVDPVSRVDLWRLITSAAADGAAVVMATTYLDEAERAASVLVLDGGRTIAAGTPREVMEGAPGTIVRLEPGQVPQWPEWSWRRGRDTHAWHPGEPLPGETAIEADMEDAVIAGTLADRASADNDPAVPPRASSGTPPEDSARRTRRAHEGKHRA